MSNPNLVRLFTQHGAVYIDTNQMAHGRRLMTAYTSHGNRLADVGATQAVRECASWGVHIDNLYALQKLADEAADAFWRELYGEAAITAKQLRKKLGTWATKAKEV